MKFNLGDKVAVLKSENEELVGKIGEIIDIDEAWAYPYDIKFDDENLNGIDKDTLFAEDELEKEFSGVIATGQVSFIDASPKYTITPSSDIITDIKNLVERVKKEYPQSRETSLTITKLDEARLWLREADEK